MADRPYSVLFLCSGNSARSILAESLLRHRGRNAFVAHSAGSHPAGRVQPMALELLQRLGLPVDGLRSKSMDEFTGPGAPPVDLVITVCDAAAETCPVFPGRPLRAHWSTPDPAVAEGSDAQRRRAYRNAFEQLERRIELLVELPLGHLDRVAREQRLAAIGLEGDTQ